MNSLHHEIRIEAPVEHVWAFYCDTSHWQDWMPRVGHLEIDGPYDKVGTTYVATMRLMGFETKTTYTVVAVEPLRLIHEHSDTGPMDNTIRFEPDGQATHMVLDSTWEMPGHWPGFIKNLVTRGWVERNTRSMLAEFKALAEATVPARA